MVAKPSAMCSCATVRPGSCRYGIVVVCAARVSRARSRRPNSPAIQPWEGQQPHQHLNPARVDQLSQRRADLLWRVCGCGVAASRLRMVAGAPGQAPVKAVMVAQSAGSAA